MQKSQLMWKEDDGALSFEWVVLITLLVIGIVSGITAVRDAYISELADSAEAIVRFDQSYTMEGVLGFPTSTYTDEPVADPVTVSRP